MRPNAPEAADEVRAALVVVNERLDKDRRTAVRCEEGRCVRTAQRILWMVEQNLRKERPVNVDHSYA